MKILHTADWHVGRTIRNRPREDEHRQVLAEIAEIAGAEAVDLILVAGDIFDAFTPTPTSEEIVYRALLDLAEVAPVVAVSGNHDHPARLRAVAPLLKLGRIHLGSSIRRPDQGGVLELEGAKIALLPFISKRGIVGVEELLSLPSAELRATFADRVQRVVRDHCAGMESDTINLVVGHLMVAGAAADGSERQAHLFEYAIPPASFPGHLSYVALGHLHRPQRVPAPAPIHYSGSPLQLDFGEEDQQKSVVLIDVEAGLPARVALRSLQSGRILRTLRGTLAELAEEKDLVGDAYLRIELAEPSRVGLAEDVRELFPNAVEIRLAQPDPDRARSTPTRVGRAPGELFREYLGVRNVDDRPLEALFDELLVEAADAGT